MTCPNIVITSEVKCIKANPAPVNPSVWKYSVKCVVPQFDSTTMNTSKIFFTVTAILGILVLITQATPVNTTSSTSPTPNSEQHHVTMDTYTAMVSKVVRVQQTVWLLLAQQYNFTNYTTALVQPFEYCFLKDIANPPSNNLTVNNSLLICIYANIIIICL